MVDAWVVMGIVVVLATVALGLASLVASGIRTRLARMRARRVQARAMARARVMARSWLGKDMSPTLHLATTAPAPLPGSPVPRPRGRPEGPLSRPGPRKPFYDRMASIMRVSESLTVEQLAAALGVDVAFVWKHVFAWALHFGFKVVDGRVVFKGGDIDGLAAELDRHFEEWEARVGSKGGKNEVLDHEG